jgi:hypothetical protein
MVVDGKAIVEDEDSGVLSAAVMRSKAKSLPESQATYFARTTCPEEKISQCVLPAAYSSAVSATQCAQVSTTPEGSIHTAVPASCCAKTRVARAAAARIAEVGVGLRARSAMKAAVCDEDEDSFLRFSCKVASSFLERLVDCEVKALGKTSIGAVFCCFSWYLGSQDCRVEISGASAGSERACDRRTRFAIIVCVSSYIRR